MKKFSIFFNLFVYIFASNAIDTRAVAALDCSDYTVVIYNGCSQQPTGITSNPQTFMDTGTCCRLNCGTNAQLSGTTCICSANYVPNGANACKSCPTGYPYSEAGATSDSDCYKSCTTVCTIGVGCQAYADCTYDTSTTNGEEYYGGSCNAPGGNCSVNSKTCHHGYWGDSNNNNPCTQCTNAKPDGAAYNGNSTTDNCPWGNVTIPVGQYYRLGDKSFQPCPTGKYCTGGAIVSSNTSADTGITGDCTKPNDANFTLGQTGASTQNGCPWGASCQRTTYWNNDERQCKPCKKGYYCKDNTSVSDAISDDQGLKPCPPGKTSPESSDADTDCNYVTVSEAGGASANATQFCNSDSSDCFTFP